MIRLAVTTGGDTFDRIREPLGERGIEVVRLSVSGRSIHVATGTGETSAMDGMGDTGSARSSPDRSFDVGFVYPSRLMEGAVLAERLSIPWINGRDAVMTSRNKAGVIATLDAAGLPVPKTTLISNPVEESVVLDAVDRFEFPLVVKPTSATRGAGVAKATDLDSLLGIVEYLNLVHEQPVTGDKSYLIQEFLPNARDFRVMIVDGEYAGAVERRLSADAIDAGRWKHNVHRGANAVRVDDWAGVDTGGVDPRSLAERTAETLDIDYLGVDLLSTDERIVVSETNARPTVDAADKYDPGFYDRLASLIERVADTG